VSPAKISAKKHFFELNQDRLPLKINDAENPDCLNCGTSYHGEFCPACGQKRIPQYYNFWELVKEFLSNYISFDSKFSRTLIPVLFRPGHLTNEYREGKRASYIPPIRLFVFVTIVFFLIVAIIPETSSISIEQSPGKDKAASIPDSLQTDLPLADNREMELTATGEIGDTIVIFGTPYPIFDTYEEYIAYREGLSKKPGFFVDLVMQQAYKLDSEDPDQLTKNLKKNFIEIMPKLVFLVMPFFALILKLLYIRRRYFYEEHFVFALHFHTFIYLLLLAIILISLADIPAIIAFPFVSLFYLFIAMRKVYGQKFWKTFFKLFITISAYTLVLIIAFLLSAIYTAMSY
jgi:hypothetical protein